MNVPGLTALHIACLAVVLRWAAAAQLPAGRLVRVGQPLDVGERLSVTEPVTVGEPLSFYRPPLTGTPSPGLARPNAPPFRAGGALPLPQPLRVMTWNIHSAPLAAIEPELRATGADIIALQEVRASHAELARLAASLGMEALFLVLVPRPKPFGIALLTRHPLEKVSYRFLPSGREPRAYLMAATAGLVVVNTHLEPSPRRRVQLQHLREAVRDLNRPVVLLGDLNEEGLGSSFDGFADAGRDAGMTYPNLQARIDYILVRGRPAGPARVLPTAKSDHYPVVAEISANPEGENEGSSRPKGSLVASAPR